MSRFSDLQELFVIVCRMICIKNGVKSKVYLIIYSGAILARVQIGKIKK